MVDNSGSDSATRLRDRRRLIAVLYADMVGYSRLIGLDDTGTLERLRRLRKEVIDPAIEEHGGRVVQTGGDSLLMVFDSVDGAVQCAIQVQRQVSELDSESSPDRAMRFRIGINIGDAIEDGTDLHGDAVNVAVRLQAECPPGGICVTRAVRDHVRHRFDLAFEELGVLRLKNIDRPVEAFALNPAKAVMVTAGTVAPTGGELQLPDRPSIVVLPFQNISSDPEQDYFADGMVEDITTALSRFRSLFVIARNSAFTYKGRSVDIREIGRQLGVRYAIEGSVRRAETRVRITCQLVQAENGAHLWAERYDRDFSDIFALQDEITTSIVSTLAPTVRRAELERASRKPVENFNVYDLYLRAMAANRRLTREGNEEARRLIDRALVLDSHFVPALTLGDGCWADGMTHGWVPRAEALERCSRYARLAVHLAPDDADALAALAVRTAAISGDHEDAVALANRAVAANPNSSGVLNKCGFTLLYAARSREALALFERALRLTPRDPNAWNILCGMGFSLIELGRDVEAVEVGRRAAQLHPASADAYRVLASALALLGRLDEAQAALQRMLELDPGCTISGIRMRYGAAERFRTLDGVRKAGMPE